MRTGRKLIKTGRYENKEAGKYWEVVYIPSLRHFEAWEGDLNPGMPEIGLMHEVKNEEQAEDFIINLIQEKGFIFEGKAQELFEHLPEDDFDAVGMFTRHGYKKIHKDLPLKKKAPNLEKVF